jgi:hypothetical protein
MVFDQDNQKPREGRGLVQGHTARDGRAGIQTQAPLVPEGASS